jgi:hypothetical protein
LFFYNYDKTGVEDDTAPDILKDAKGEFVTIAKDRSYIDLMSIIPPMSGGITRTHQNAIEAYEGVTLSEYSLQFLGSFLLGSLVRYKPQIWQHAISRSSSSQWPPDDRCLALVERFLDLVLGNFPNLLVHVMDFTGRRY